MISNLPWWVQGIAWVGAPVAGLGWVLYFLLGNFNVKLDSIDKRLGSHEVASSAVSAAFTKHLDDDSQQSWMLIGIMQRICLNTSKSDEDRLACGGLAGRSR